MAAFTNLLGQSVVNNKGAKVDSASLAGNDVVGCGPCRNFTPMLIQTYNKMKADGKKFEIVFVSGDHGAKQFNEYFSSMPWLAVPFEAREVEQQLSAQFEVEGIPTLVFLDNTGKLLTKDGRGKIAADPEGARFPWRPRPVFELFDHAVNHEGTKVPMDAIRTNEVIGLYFSAHWCPPCRGFTPALAKTYEKVKAQGKKLEIIFVSSDRDEPSFKAYFAEMPWLALPFADRATKAELSQMYEVEGIPTLVLLGPDGKVITADGREELGEDPEGARFPWRPSPPRPLELLTGKTVNLLNKVPCILALLDKLDAAALAALLPGLEKVAQEHFAGEESKLRFLYADESARGIAASVRNFLHIPDAPLPVLVYINIGRQQKLVLPGPVTAEAVAALTKQFLDGSLKAVPIRE